ncbi:MAG: OmpA family protein [Flavobacteriaceae bacterium]|nr:OmpA family protein [Flavobacteriaceae bacterium]
MKKYITVVLLLSLTASFGQRKYSADKYYEEFAYVKSAELYKKIVQKGDSTKHVLSRLGDSYYFNSNTKEAEIWYKKLFQNYKNDSISELYYFRYAQSLKSNGNYKESDAWLLKMNSIRSNDSRVSSLVNQPNYVNKYLNVTQKFVKIHNLSSNSKYSDYGAFSMGNKVLFSSTRPKLNTTDAQIYVWNEQPYYNVYQAERVIFSTDKNINFSDLKSVKKLMDISSPYHDASAILTKDGNTMYFTRDNYDGKKLQNDENKVTHLKLYTAKLIDGVWSGIKELPFNSDAYSTGHPALSLDEKTLFFTSDMPGGFGATDIYKVAIKPNGAFGEPKNLGNTINTEGNEMFPFVGSDRQMYFSSNGHIGLGGLDVFKINLEVANDKVINLGSPINSPKDDFSFTVNYEDKIGYFSSNRTGGKGDDDVYSFVVKDKPPVCKQQIEGVVFNKITNQLLAGAKVYLTNLNNVKIDSMLVGETAMFKFNAMCNTAYKVIAEKQYFIPDYSVFSTPKISGVTEVKLELEIQKDFAYSSNGELVININPIYFDFDKSNIRIDASVELDKVVSIMNKYPALIIRSSSHTDSRGNDAYNILLSSRRAISTVKYIVSKGIAGTRISGKGFGETELVNTCSNGENCTEEEHQLNRRTEFVIINIGRLGNLKELPKTHKVRRGDTLYSIAKSNNLTLKMLMELNQLKELKIYEGQLLKLK